VLVAVADGTWTPIVAVVSFVLGAAMRVGRAEADLERR
jgi:hypothetical protein